MTPTVGRIVRFHGAVAHDGRGEYAAIVTRVHRDGDVDLTVFGPTATCFRADVPEGPIARGDFWTWPPQPKGEVHS